MNFTGALMSQADISDVLAVCRNPLYPSPSDYQRLKHRLRTFKGYRRENWWSGYQQWAGDHAELRRCEL